MRAVTLHADWELNEGFRLGPKDVEGKLTYSGHQVWRHPWLEVAEKTEPELTESTEVILRVRACGTCGSDVHLAETDERGYMLYPGLTALPCTLGHEFSGVIVEAGKDALNKRTGRKFEASEPVTVEEMIWCGMCRPCCDGYPNHCERLQELGFTVDGGMAEYVKVDSRYVWSLEPLKEVYGSLEDVLLAGSLTEPASVVYNAVIERAGGICPGENVVVLGGGPIGLIACAVLRRAGANLIILTEPSESRSEIGVRLGATHCINPHKEENVAEAILDITKGQGAKLYLEAAGNFEQTWPTIEECILRGKGVNATVVLVGRAGSKVPMNPEVFQTRRAQIVGAQGHSGHGNFPNVIESMASGMDVTPVITKKIGLEEVPESLKLLQTDKRECKVTVIP